MGALNLKSASSNNKERLPYPITVQFYIITNKLFQKLAA